MELTEKTLSSEKIFDGRILHIRRDTVLLPNGHQSTREVVDHPGGVSVLALDDQNRVLIVSQFRYPYEEVLREIPAGKLEYGEDPAEAARRELREETGAVAGSFQSLGELYPSPGYCGEIIRMYLARELSFGDTDPDEDEFLGLERVPFAQLVNTPGSIAYPDIRLTGACPGRGIWGYSPLERREGHPDLQPAMVAWKSRLLIVKDVTGGKLGPNFEAVRLDKPKRIGILAGGVSDGVSQKQARGGVVLVRGKRVPICSPMSLEHMTIDLTDCPNAQPGDEVVIMGRQGDEEITREELMEMWGVNIPYYWTAIPDHLERVYFENGAPVAVARGYEIETL